VSEAPAGPARSVFVDTSAHYSLIDRHFAQYGQTILRP
jgi:hypothetical protein